MIYVIIASFIAFASYITSVMLVSKRQTGNPIPPSVSENFYLFEEVKQGLGWIFYGWCAVIGIIVMAGMFELSEGKWYQFLPLFAGFGLVLVGCAPRFRGEERRMHQTGALLCAVAAVLWCSLAGYGVVMLVSLILSYTLSLSDWEKRIFWWEIGIFIATYLVMFWEVLK